MRGYKPSGPTYNGNPVHPIIEKSLKPLLEGEVEQVTRQLAKKCLTILQFGRETGKQ
jgi:hypothetical protein